MYQLILLVHVFAAVFIVALVLIQQGKGATLGAAFGSGASQTVFGSRGSGSFLFRVTIGLISLFFITSISLNYIVAHRYAEQKQIVFPVINQPVSEKNDIKAMENSIRQSQSPTQKNMSQSNTSQVKQNIQHIQQSHIKHIKQSASLQSKPGQGNPNQVADNKVPAVAQPSLVDGLPDKSIPDKEKARANKIN